MKTLYLRNVPDEVIERDGMSVAAIAVRELTQASRRADNPALLGALPDLGIEAASVVTDLEAERPGR